MTTLAIGIIVGWLTALAVVAIVDSWPAPGERDARDADTEESGW